MSTRVLEAATRAVAYAFAAHADAPVEKVAARAGARRWRGSLEELATSWRGVADELSRIDRLHAGNAARIEAWAELPGGSAASVAEARALVDAVDDEIGRLKAVRHRLERTAKGAADVTAAVPHLATIVDEVGRWLRDAEADRANLLVAARAVVAREKPAAGRGAGIVEIPLSVQVERALASAYAAREAREDLVRAAAWLDDYARAKLRADVAREEALRAALAARVDAALAAAREAAVAPAKDLVEAADRLRAWAFDLSQVRTRIDRGAGRTPNPEGRG